MSNERPKKPGFYFVDTAERDDVHSHVVQVRDDGKIFALGVQGPINWPEHMLRNWRPAVDDHVLRQGANDTVGVAVRVKSDQVYCLLPDGTKPFGTICLDGSDPQIVCAEISRQVRTAVRCLLEKREVRDGPLDVDPLIEQVCCFLGVGGAAIMTVLQMWKNDLEKYDKLRRALREVVNAQVVDPELATLLTELKEFL